MHAVHVFGNYMDMVSMHAIFGNYLIGHGIYLFVSYLPFDGCI